VTIEGRLYRVLRPMGSNFGDIDNDGFLLDIYLARAAGDSYLNPHVCAERDGTRRGTSPRRR